MVASGTHITGLKYVPYLSPVLKHKLNLDHRPHLNFLNKPAEQIPIELIYLCFDPLLVHHP